MNKINLVEILHPKMEILFVALNPPVNSNNNGHYFSNNLSFWNVLLKSGLIVKPVKSKMTGDEEVFRNNRINFKNAIYGITDLVHDLVETNSNKVNIGNSRVQRILNLLEKYEIKTLCIMHSKVANAFQDNGVIRRTPNYGKVGTYKSTTICEVPFHNAPISNKDKFYELIKEAIN